MFTHIMESQPCRKDCSDPEGLLSTDGQEAQALVFLGAENQPAVELRAVDIPPVLGAGQILAKIRLCTVCGSDLHTLSGKRKEACPSILGHEAVAEVVLCNRECCPCNRGDRITFSIVDCCMSCGPCVSGYPQKCKSLAKYGHLPLSHQSGLNGTYASHIILNRNTQTFVIPKTLSDEAVAPINCSLATMVNATSQISQNGHINTALVQGAGLLGVYCCLLLKEHLSLQRIICTDINMHRLGLASQFGATETCTSSTDIPGCSVDVVLEVCGHPSVIEEGLRCLRPGGKYILVGLVHPDSHLKLTGETLIRKCLTITGIHNYKPQDLGEAVKFIETIHDKYPLHLITGTVFPLGDFQKAFDCAQQMKYLRVAMKPTHC